MLGSRIDAAEFSASGVGGVDGLVVAVDVGPRRSGGGEPGEG